MSVKFAADIGNMLDFGGDAESEWSEGAHLTKQGNKPVSVVDIQLTIILIELHQLTSCLQAAGERRNLWIKVKIAQK